MITLARDGRGILLDVGAGRPLRVAAVDGHALERRATRLMGRAIAGPSRAAGLELAVRCIDLTTLEGADTPGRVRALCARALRPDPDDPAVPPVAAVCVYPSLVAVAAEALGGHGVRVAAVAGAFPSGRGHLDDRLGEIRRAVADGADEVDIVLDRGALLAGRLQEAFDGVAASKEACGGARLKTILETAELGSHANVRLAAALAMAAGSDVIKTSTGKLPVPAPPSAALCMAEAIRDHAETTGRRVGLKIAGGIRTSTQALGLLALVAETLGPAWLHPDRLRLGASSLLGDILLQLRSARTGRDARTTDLPAD